MENIVSGIYKIRNIVNNKVYVGSAVDFKDRKCKHFSNLKSKKHHNLYLQNSYNKHGKENFIFEIIEYIACNKKLLLEREDYWIDLLKANQREFGYNIRKVASSSLGMKHSKEAKEKISSWRIGMQFSSEHKKNLSKNHPDFSRENHPMWGKKHTDESINKISLSRKGKCKGKNNPNWHKDISITTRERLSVANVGKKRNNKFESKYVGIRKSGKKFSAKICRMRKHYYLGMFLTEQEAAIAYNLKARELYGINYDINIIE